MKEVNRKLLQWLRENEATLKLNLNPPADVKSIDECQKVTGEIFPDLLRELYLQFDGQAWDFKNGIFYEYAFSPLENVIDMVVNYEAQPSKDDLVNSGLWENETVKSYDNYPKWVPFAEDGTGHYLSLDYDPGVNGRNGQVIVHGADGENKVLADCFTDFMNWHVDRLETGNYYIGEPPEGIYEEPTTVFSLEKGKRLIPELRPFR